jgi:predicted glycogen debranching enzyme
MKQELEHQEWLEADGLGGFASGTAAGVRTRRSHALLLRALRPPVNRFALVNGFEAWVESDGKTIPITTQRYAPDVLHPDGADRILEFEVSPWPTWRIRVDDRLELQQEIVVEKDGAATLLSWKLNGTRPKQPVILGVRFLLSGRDAGALHRENPALSWDSVESAGAITWQPYPGVPAIRVEHNGSYEHDPQWYRNFLYREESRRGLDDREDLASPGTLRFDLHRGEAVCLLSAIESEARETVAPTDHAASPDHGATNAGNGSRIADVLTRAKQIRAVEKKRRAAFADPLERAADAYIVRRGNGKTILAGYPWFTDWGRDTMIALRGLCLATGRLEDSREILLEWTNALSEGMLPNRFLEHGDPEYNSVDAALWFVISAAELLAKAPARGFRLSEEDENRLHSAADLILQAYAHGTRHRIAMDEDGLLKCGEPGTQLTWMDAKIGNHTVTGRIGKPVEVQALWLNALHAARTWSPNWKVYFEQALSSFVNRFWNEEAQCLYDVIDVDHQPGICDDSIRPNQIFAVGGLPLTLLSEQRALHVVDRVEQDLWTPLGLRTLSPRSPEYHGTYAGDRRSRDESYHQGTAWPWLLGPFVDAWVRVRQRTDEAKREARERFVTPLLQHLQVGGMGHVGEIFDGDAPNARGTPFQAWSLGELLRIEREILGEPVAPRKTPAKRAQTPNSEPEHREAMSAALPATTKAKSEQPVKAAKAKPASNPAAPAPSMPKTNSKKAGAKKKR